MLVAAAGPLPLPPRRERWRKRGRGARASTSTCLRPFAQAPPTRPDTQAAVGAIVDGLVSALVTLGAVPIIRCPRGGAAEHVAAALESRLRDLLKGRSNLFSEGGPGALGATLSRPLLVLFDRNFDLSVMLQHAWSYKPLVQVRLGLGRGPGRLGAGLLAGRRRRGLHASGVWPRAAAATTPRRRRAHPPP